MDGVVNVGRDELTTLATNHNGHVETSSRLAEGKESMKDYPPVQLDHSTSAKDTVGRLIGKLELGEYKTKDGREVMAAYGNVKILGEENVVKVMDGRWTHLSVGVDFEKGKFSELTITPFPAAPEASLLKKDIKLGNHWTEGKDFAAHITTGQNADGSWRFNTLSKDHDTGKQGFFKTESQAVTDLLKKDLERLADKQIWQYTKAEYEQKYGKPRGNTTGTGGFSSHKSAVEIAINRGFPVPKNVLKDYPDLAKEAGLQLSSKDTEMSGERSTKEEALKIAKSIYLKVAPQNAPVVDYDSDGIVSLFFETREDATKAEGLLKSSGKFKSIRKDVDSVHAYLSSKDTEMGKKKNKVLINGQEPHVQLSEGDKPMDKDKMKKHMMDEHKMSEKEAEEKLAKCTEEEMKKLAAEVEEHEKKMSEKEDEDKKEMAEETDDEKKEMSKEEEDEKKSLAEKEDEEKEEMESAEKEKKLSAARERIVRLSSDFRKAFEVSQLAAKKGRILSRLSSLKASAKITPAEIKKIDVEKLASQGSETVDLVLKTYEDREPVIMTGALGSIKADELHKLSSEIRMSRLEAETRKNMSLLKHTVKTKMQEGQAPEEVSIHVDTTPHVHQEMAKCYGDVCKMMDEGKLAEAKELLKKYMMKPESEGRMDMVEHDKQLSALAEESIKMQNKFDELQKLAVTLVG